MADYPVDLSGPWHPGQTWGISQPSYGETEDDNATPPSIYRVRVISAVMNKETGSLVSDDGSKLPEALQGVTWSQVGGSVSLTVNRTLDSLLSGAQETITEDGDQGRGPETAAKPKIFTTNGNITVRDTTSGEERRFDIALDPVTGTNDRREVFVDICPVSVQSEQREDWRPEPWLGLAGRIEHYRLDLDAYAPTDFQAGPPLLLDSNGKAIYIEKASSPAESIGSLASSDKLDLSANALRPNSWYDLFPQQQEQDPSDLQHSLGLEIAW